MRKLVSYSLLCTYLVLFQFTPLLAIAEVNGTSLLINESVQQLLKRYAPQNLNSVTTAEAAIEQSERLQNQVQQYYLDTEKACNERFFVNNCIEETRLQRRTWQDQIRAITQAAKAYIRQAKNAVKIKQTEANSK